jgi:methenyltetrahydromethanopterin cyclohydrolase
VNLSLNRRALALADQLAEDAEAYGVAVQTLANGARLIDCGIAAPGGLEAGRLFAEICMGGLGQVSFASSVLDGWWLPSVVVTSDHPIEACLAAQYAGWAVQRDTFFALGSGPARALARAEKLFEELEHRERADVAVLCLETRAPPTADVAAYVAERAGVPTAALTLLAAPTASLAGGVQVASRVLETALHKLHALGFDLRQVLSGFGTAPLPPTARSDARAIGRTNDAVLYGGRVGLHVRTDDDALEALMPRVPSSSSTAYGDPFYATLKRFDFDFYKIDPLLFSPAEITVTNAASGRVFHAGQVNPGVLRQSFVHDR